MSAMPLRHLRRPRGAGGHLFASKEEDVPREAPPATPFKFPVHLGTLRLPLVEVRA